jgi:serine/threonine-protein kinase
MPAVAREVSERMRSRVGATVGGELRLDGLVGAGATSAVYAATRRGGEPVAVKVLYPELGAVDEIRARFVREAYVANRIPHDGVVRVLGHGDDDDLGTAFLVMELLEGETLAGRTRGFDEVIRCTLRALDVLQAAHDQRIVHRDVKPENLFVTSSGELKVLDFGAARLLDGTSATRSGQLLGTPAFMPPEQAGGRARDVDARSDVWSIGAVAFTLLAGRYVHPARSAAEQMIYAATRPAPPLASVADVPSRVARVVDRALAFDRDARWPSARAMRDALLEA